MKKSIHHSVSALLLLSYAAASIFGHLPLLYALVNGTISEKSFTSAKHSRSNSSIPIWTQKKHTPVFHKEISDASLPVEKFQHNNCLRIPAFAHPAEFSFHQSEYSSPLGSRAPPAILSVI